MKREIAPLTGIRGLAAFAVMIYHIPHHPAFGVFVVPGFGRSYLAVDLFFVLSGFVMALSYGRLFTSWWSRADFPAAFLGFMGKRYARVYPVFFVVTAAFLLKSLLNVSGVQEHAVTGPDLLANLFMAQSWGWGTHAIAGNSWSVSVEVLAYLLFPLLVGLAFSRFWALQVVAAGAGLAAVVLLGHGGSGPLDVVDELTILPALRCLAGFSLGLVAYRFAQGAMARRWLAGDGAVAGLLVALGLLLALPGSDLAVVAVLPFFIAALYYNGRAAAALFGNRLVHHLGVISYSMYLWHPLFRDIAARGMGVAHGRGLAAPDWLFVLAAVAVTWAASWASYVFIEVKGRELVNAAAGRLRRTS